MKKTIRFIVLPAIALLLAGLTACAGETDDVDEVDDSDVLPSDFPDKIMDELAVLVALDFIGNPYSDEITSDYAAQFIYHLAMRSYFDRAKTYEGAIFDSTTRYVAFTQDEVAEMLDLAFGERFSLGDFEPEAASYTWVINDTDTYYVSIGETLPVEIEYQSTSGDDTAVYAYMLDTSMTRASGAVTATVTASSKNAAGVSITDIDIDEQSRVNEDEEQDDTATGTADIYPFDTSYFEQIADYYSQAPDLFSTIGTPPTMLTIEGSYGGFRVISTPSDLAVAQKQATDTMAEAGYVQVPDISAKLDFSSEVGADDVVYYRDSDKTFVSVSIEGNSLAYFQ
jgi:hypothetical protein